MYSSWGREGVGEEEEEEEEQEEWEEADVSTMFRNRSSSSCTPSGVPTVHPVRRQ